MAPRYLPLVWISAAILGLFGTVLFQDQSFAMRDAAHFYHPLFQWITSEWREGRFPLWNPYENCGVPLLADASSSLLYPGKVIFLLPVDFVWLYKVYVISHVALAAAGMYRLCRAWECTSAAATLAAIAYACGGNVAFQHCNVVFLVGAAWLPWAMRELRLLHSPAETLRGPLLRLGMILALMVLGGDPQMAYHTLLIQLFWVAGILWQSFKRSRLDPSARSANGSLANVRRSMVTLFAATLLMLGLAAVQFLPSSDAAGRSERSCYRDPRSIWEALRMVREEGSAAKSDLAPPLTTVSTDRPSIARGLLGTPEEGMHHERLYDFSIGPWRWIEFIWPNVSGRMFPTQRRWLSHLPAEQRTWTPTMYMGLLPVLLGLLGMWRKESDAQERWLRLVAIWFLAGSLGWYGAGWVIREISSSLLHQDSRQFSFGSPIGGVYWLMVTVLPSYVGFRYPAKLMVVAIVPLCVFAARQLDRVPQDAEARHRLRQSGAGLMWISIGIALLLWVFWRSIMPIKLPADLSHGPFDMAGAKWDVFSAFIHSVVVLFALRRQLSPADAEAGKSIPWAIVGLTVVELVIANAWMIPTAPASIWRNESPVVIAMHAQKSRDLSPDAQEEIPRFYRGNLQGWRPTPFRQAASKGRMQQLTAWDHDSLFPKFGLTQKTSAVFSYGSIKPVDFESFFAIADRYGPPQETDDAMGRAWVRLPHLAPLRLLGTEFIVAPDSAVLSHSGQKPFADKVAISQEEKWPQGTGLWKLTQPSQRVWIVRSIELLPSIEGSHDIVKIDAQTEQSLFPHREDGKQRRTRNFFKEATVETEDASLREELLAITQKAKAVEVPVDSKGTGDTCKITRYAANQVTITAELNEPGLMVMNDAYDPNWVATLQTSDSDSKDVRSIPILRTDRIARGISLPPGKHTIEMYYRPLSLYWGAVISGGMWLAVLLLLATEIRLGNKKAPPEE